jgi:hypothetical protein
MRGVVADLSNLTPDDIKNLASLAEIAKGVDPTAAKIIGGIGSVIGAALLVWTHIRTLITKKNTAANEATVKELNDVEFRISKKADTTLERAETVATELKESLDFKMNQLLTEMNNLKIVIAKVNISHEQRLSMIPKIQDRLENVEKRGLETDFRQAKTDEKLEAFIHELIRAQGRRKP